MPTPTTTRYRLETSVSTQGTRGMLHRLTDENAGLRVSVAPFAGAEIASIQTKQKGTWLEVLDRAENFSPCERWRGRAPWLWPAVGRSYAPRKLEEALRTGEPLSQFEWERDGKVYPMPIHGFVMNRQWKVTNTQLSGDGAVVECELADDLKTRECYPFGFLLHLTFRLAEGTLRAKLRVDAANSNDGAMPFCIGNHITLRAPLTSVGRFEDVRIFAPVRRVYSVTRLGLAGEPSELSFREGVALSDQRLLNLIVGHFPPEQATVRFADSSGVEVEVGHRELTASSSAKAPADSFYFVFYGSPEHKFFCPEPWLGLPNALNEDGSTVRLRAGERFEWEMMVRITSASP